MANNLRICIDPGHGGVDPGAVNSIVGIKESTVNLAVAKRLKLMLENDGHSVILTRSWAVYKTLGQRVRKANNWKADLFVSIHCNAAANRSAAGIETFMASAGSSKSRLFRGKIQSSLVKQFPSHKDRGVKSANYYVLRKTRMPAVLVEMEFISNYDMARKLANTSTQYSFASSIATGIRWANHAK